MLFSLLALVLCSESGVGRKKPSIAAGIDLGTTYTCVYLFTPDITSDRDAGAQGSLGAATLESLKFGSSDIIPSVVRYEMIHNDWILNAGNDAFNDNEAKPDPNNYFYAFKRLMGRSSLTEDRDLIDIDKKVTYKLKEKRINEKQGLLTMLHIGNDGNTLHELTAVQASAAILEMIRKKIEEDYIIKKCVITVPAYFGENQRAATTMAAKLAGFNDIILHKEPVAAAYAYQIKKGLGSDGSKFIVFDQGGGTLDITALEYADTVLEVAATVGNNFLGGENINDLLFNHFAKKLKDEHNEQSIDTNSKARLRLRKFVEEFKIELCNKQNQSTDDVSHTQEFFLPSGGIAQMSLTTSKFNEIIQPVLSKIDERLVDEVYGIIPKLKDYGWNLNEISDVLCVGGTSRVPIIRKKLRDYFPKANLRYDIDPDRIVAEGAAYQAASSANFLKKGESLVQMDTVPIPIGICVKEDEFHPILKEQATIPATGTEVFTTSEDNQKLVLIKVAQGLSPSFKENEPLGQFHLEIEKPAPRGVPQIEVTIHWSLEGNLNVNAADLSNKREAKITFARSDAQLSEAKINELRKKAKEDEVRNAEMRDAYKERNLLEEYIRDVQSRMMDSSITNESRDLIERAVYGVNAWLIKEKAKADKYQFKEKLEKLKEVVMPLLAGKGPAAEEKIRDEL